MNPEEIRKQLAQYGTELEELRKVESLSDEQDKRLDELIGLINTTGDKLARALNAEAAAKASADAKRALDEAQQSAGRVSGLVPGDQRNDGYGADRRTIGQRFADFEGITALKKNGITKGTRSGAFNVGSFYRRHMEHAYDENQGALDRRAVITSPITADFVEPYRVPGIFQPEDLQGSLRDVLINGTTGTDTIMFFRELLFTNNAAGVPQATHTAPGDETPANASVKPESALTFEQDTAPVVTIAHWIPITRQAIEDQSQLRTYVENRLIDGLRLAESDQLINGTGTPDLDGILQTSGIQDLDGTYFGTSPVADAGNGNENFNRVLRAKTLVRTVGRARANFVVINPADYEYFLTASTATEGQYYGTGPFGPPTVSSLWGLRVVEDENIAAGTALVGDGRMAAVWDRMQSTVEAGYIDNQFVRNMLTLLAEERIALSVYRPAAFAAVELAAW